MTAPTTSGAQDVASNCAADSEQKLPSHEEQLAAMTARVEELQKQDPSADLKLEQKWWVPSVDFGSYLQVSSRSRSRIVPFLLVFSHDEHVVLHKQAVR